MTCGVADGGEKYANRKSSKAQEAYSLSVEMNLPPKRSLDPVLPLTILMKYPFLPVLAQTTRDGVTRLCRRAVSPFTRSLSGLAVCVSVTRLVGAVGSPDGGGSPRDPQGTAVSTEDAARTLKPVIVM